MSNQVKSLFAELKNVIYKHAEAENTIIKLRAQIGDLEEKAYWKEISDIQADEYQNELENKVEKLTKVIKMLKLEAGYTSDKYLRGAILRHTVTALKQESE